MGLIASLIILVSALTSLDHLFFKAQDIILFFTLTNDTNCLAYYTVMTAAPPYLYLLSTSLTYMARYDI